MANTRTMEQRFTAILTKEKSEFIAYNPETGVASQGKSKSEAISNLKEAVELFLEEDPIGIPEKRDVVKFTAKVKTHA